MKIVIKKGDKIAFLGEVKDIEELKQILASIKRADKELGYNFTYEVDGITDLAISLLNTLTDRYFYSIAKEKGDYINMGEILHDAQAGDPDATFLKQLYDAIWAKEEELEKQLEEMSLDQLLELDLEAWAREQYDAVKAELENQTENTES